LTVSLLHSCLLMLTLMLCDPLSFDMQTLNGETLQNVPIILFLNKEDLFAEKIKVVPIKSVYKKYKGGKSFETGCEFIRDKFLETMDDRAPLKPEEVYVHVACAINTGSSGVTPHCALLTHIPFTCPLLVPFICLLYFFMFRLSPPFYYFLFMYH